LEFELLQDRVGVEGRYATRREETSERGAKAAQMSEIGTRDVSVATSTAWGSRRLATIRPITVAKPTCQEKARLFVLLAGVLGMKSEKRVSKIQPECIIVSATKPNGNPG
jgi:hypothetical protein